MNEIHPDFELLARFAQHGDQSAFAAVVERHVNLVYATALRKVNEPAVAEEIVQDVFAALARHAWHFAADDSVPAWLYKTTLLKAKAWWRAEMRRRQREKTAAELGTVMNFSENRSAANALVPQLDEALLSLKEKDRIALLLRFYENRSLREVGVSLRVSEDTAQKRVASALDKLAVYFQRRGYRTVTAASAAVVLQQTTASAPAIFAAAAIQAAVQAGAPILAGPLGWLARLAALTKTQAAAACLALVAVSLGWQVAAYRSALQSATAAQIQKASIEQTEAELKAEMDRWRAQLAQIDVQLTANAQTAEDQAENRRVLDQARARVRAMLSEAQYHWPEDFPFVRIPKAIVKEMADKGMMFIAGKMSDQTEAFLAATPAEAAEGRRLLDEYWQGVKLLQDSASAYETNAPAQPGHRIAKTVYVPPLGQPMKDLAKEIGGQLTALLGEEREQLLFGGWDEGGIQTFWPGNLWKISEEWQTYTVWIDRGPTGTDAPTCRVSWESAKGGSMEELGTIPPTIRERFFTPWLQGLGIRQ